MKQTKLIMAPNAAETLQYVIGICVANEPDLLIEGSGFNMIRWIENDLAEYGIACDDVLYNQAIEEMLARGLTITFPPEPEVLISEVIE